MQTTGHTNGEIVKVIRAESVHKYFDQNVRGNVFARRKVVSTGTSDATLARSIPTKIHVLESSDGLEIDRCLQTTMAT